MVRPPRSALRSASAPGRQPRLLAGAFRGSGPARSGRHRLTLLRFSANRSGRRVGIYRLQPRPKTAVASAAAFTRPVGFRSLAEQWDCPPFLSPVAPHTPRLLAVENDSAAKTSARAYALSRLLHKLRHFRCIFSRFSRRLASGLSEGRVEKPLRRGALEITLKEKNFLLFSSAAERLQREILPIEEGLTLAVCLLQMRSSHPAKA